MKNRHVIKRKSILWSRDLTETRVAELIGVTKQAVNQEMRGFGASERIRQELCRLTNTTPAEFWPEFYGEEHAA